MKKPRKTTCNRFQFLEPIMFCNSSFLFSLVLFALLPVGCLATNYIIKFVSGTSGNGYMYGITMDTDGVIYMAYSYSYIIKKVSSGTLTTYAGTDGSSGSTGDGGAATSATFKLPFDLWIDKNKNLFVSDQSGHKIRKITSSGIISTYAGTGTSGTASNNIAATSATFNNPTGIFGTTDGTVYVADQGNYVLRKISSSGIVTTIAGTGSSGTSTSSGSGTSIALSLVYDVWVDTAGVIFLSDYYTVRKLSTSGIMSTITSAISTPYAIGGDSVGNLYVGSPTTYYVKKIDSSNIVSTVGGGCRGWFSENGPASSSCIGESYGVMADTNGVIYAGDAYFGLVYRFLSLDPTATPTKTPTSMPSAPSFAPTRAPTFTPSAVPSLAPVFGPTAEPTAMPSNPTFAPSQGPTHVPTHEPTDAPTAQPTAPPTASPSQLPTATPSATPTAGPTAAPTASPTAAPTDAPTSAPTAAPSHVPSAPPSHLPTFGPTAAPTTFPTDAPTAAPTAAPTEVPTSSPTCGICQPGYYGDIPADNSTCVTCHACVYPSTSISAGQETCSGVWLKSSQGFLAGVFTMLCFVFVACIYLAGKMEYRVNALALMMFPAMDVLTDAAYILTTRFASIPLFVFAIIFFIAPNGIFVYKLYKAGAYPVYFMIPLPKQMIQMQWLGYSSTSPTILGKPKVLFDHHDSIPKLLIFGLLWVGLALAQGFTYLFYGGYYLANALLIPSWLLIGLYLFQTKVMALKTVHDAWFRVWTGSDRYDVANEIDPLILNESILAEFVCESLPQMVLQSINNTLIDSWTPVGILSSVISIAMAANGLVWYLYYIYWKGLSLQDVPTKVSFGGVVSVWKQEYSSFKIYPTHSKTVSVSEALHNLPHIPLPKLPHLTTSATSSEVELAGGGGGDSRHKYSVASQQESQQGYSAGAQHHAMDAAGYFFA